MTVVRPERPDHALLSGGELHGTTFAPARGFTRGYDADQVDAFVRQCADLVDKIETKHRSLVAEPHDSEEALWELALARSRDAIASAERAGAAVVVRAQQVAEELRAEALKIRAEAMARAGALVREAEVHSENLLSQARLQVEAMDREAQARLQQMQGAADARARQAQDDHQARLLELQQEVESRLRQLQADAERAKARTRAETAQLAMLREDVRVQMHDFLADMLDRVAASRASDDPALEGVVDVHRIDRAPGPVASDRSAVGLARGKNVRRRQRRPYRIAGQSAQATVAEQLLPAPRHGD